MDVFWRLELKNAIIKLSYLLRYRGGARSRTMTTTKMVVSGVVVTLLHKSDQIITCAIQTASTGDQFIFSTIYASNSMTERRRLWDSIRSTHAAYKHLSLPWILAGDYNTIFSSSEHSRWQDYLGDQSGMRHFQELITDVGLSDLSFSSSPFTWWNKRGADPIGKKLDRALVNGDWLRVYPNSFANFETGGISDHARCLVRLQQRVERTRRPL